MGQIINELESVKKHSDYLSNELDKLIVYTESVASRINDMTEYLDWISEISDIPSYYEYGLMDKDEKDRSLKIMMRKSRLDKILKDNNED